MPRSLTRDAVRSWARALAPVRKVARTPVRKAARTSVRKAARTPVKKAVRTPARKAAKATVKVGTWHQATYHGRAGVRGYFVYVPPGLRRRTPVPLVVLLHGCRQNAAEFAAATRFNALADRHKFIVVYPEQTMWSHRYRCWQWYERAHQARGAGEPALLAEITREVVDEADRWRIDPARVYVAGLSAGGAMALVLAATYPDVYAAVGVHSAPAYRSAANSGEALRAMAGQVGLPSANGTGPLPPAIVFQGVADSTVRVRSGQLVVEQWLAAHPDDPHDPQRVARNRTKVGRSADGRTYTVARWYTARLRKVLEYWQVDELAHAWSGGAPDGSFSDPRGPRASTEMWRFFSGKRLPGS